MADELIAWSDDFSVCNEVIDRQHKGLITMTNEFYAGCQRNEYLVKVYFLKTLQGAVNYAKTHFVAEEEVMRRADYPDLAAHKVEHDNFSVHVMEQVKIFENEPNPDPASFVKMLMDWILHHVAECDKKYAPYIVKLDQQSLAAGSGV